jgi:dCTP deaminase
MADQNNSTQTLNNNQASNGNPNSIYKYGPVLSDKDIQMALKNNDIVIEPFNIKNLGNNSYDVTIGENYYMWNNNITFNPYETLGDALGNFQNSIYNPFSKEHVNKLWKLYKADYLPENFGDHTFDRSKKYILLYPKQTILAHTQEFIGGRCDNITTKMFARSSIGRSCISVCKCAGLGDIGYFNRWTMEIENCSNHIIALPVGARIAQIVFMSTGKTDNPYCLKGAYQKDNTLQELINNWSPEMMLPNLRS